MMKFLSYFHLRNKTFFFTTALLAMGAAPFAAAHSLHLFAQYDGQYITGKAYYSDMTPAADTYIEAYALGENTPLVFGKTDPQGGFRLPIVSDKSLNVVIEGMEGHRAEVVADKQQQLPSNQDLLLLRQDIHQLKDKIYLHDILGGLGYIVGLMGLALWWKSRKMQGNQ